jgi:hypothetical protein
MAAFLCPGNDSTGYVAPLSRLESIDLGRRTSDSPLRLSAPTLPLLSVFLRGIRLDGCFSKRGVWLKCGNFPALSRRPPMRSLVRSWPHLRVIPRQLSRKFPGAIL